MIASATNRTVWLHRFGFRFWCAYLALFAFSQLVVLFGKLGGLGDLYEQWYVTLATWAGKHVFHLQRPLIHATNGSGDTTFDWIDAWCTLMTALFAALVWVWFDRERKRDSVVHEVMRVTIRYALALVLVSYGLVKVLSTQFPPPSFDRLVQPYGYSSPMGLLWTFMGASRPYELAAGVLETISGLLLMFRRTTTLGAILTTAVMTNIVLLNFCYDVPVKLYSSQLLLLALWLLVPEARRLADLFLLNRPVAPADLARAWPTRKWAGLALILKVVLIGRILYLCSIPVWQEGREEAEKMATSRLYGLFEVVEFSHGRGPEGTQPMPPDGGRWQYVSFNRYDRFIGRKPDGSRERFQMQPEKDKDAFTVETEGPNGTKVISKLAYRRNADELVLEGELLGKPLALKARRVDTAKFSLLNRGFHWVNESPPNW